ncbi:hypothetical protein Tco_1214661 [Tanacetum coccineum]
MNDSWFWCHHLPDCLLLMLLFGKQICNDQWPSAAPTDFHENNGRKYHNCLDMVSDDVRGDPEQQHKTFLRSFIDRAFLLQRGNVATVEQEVAATVESMEKAARYTSNKYVDASLNSATVLLPYLVPVSCFSSLYLYDITLMLPI